MKTVYIILAAGRGQRLGRGPKAFVQMYGKTLLQHNLEICSAHKQIDEVVVVAPSEHIATARKLAKPYGAIVVAGGQTRAMSLAAGLKKCAKDDIAIVHNVANPFVSSAEMSQVIRAGKKYGAAGLGRPVSSTIKKVSGRKLTETLDRTQLVAMETPQVVRVDLLRAGLRVAERRRLEHTDDVQLAELAGVTPRLVLARPENIKITTPADMPTEYRTAVGEDSHRFVCCHTEEQSISKNDVALRDTSPREVTQGDKPLVLGGVQIAKTRGLDGNSDADVIIHALCNALSSAIGEGSLSTWSDAMCKKGITDSREYLRIVYEKVASHGWRVTSCSVSLEGKRPKLERYLPKINRSLAMLLTCPLDAVGCTVTSGERLTAFGRGEGLRATVVVTLQR